MKTKLDLYLAVHAAAVETLDAKPAEAEKRLDELLKPVPIPAEERNKFSTLFHSARQAFKSEPIANEPPPKAK